ncbi:MAG: hypothetical protein B7W97_02165, partial [Mycobacterium sp. 20-66-4]
MSVAQRERAALVETMRSLGPDAATLCDGWTTRDLAAHLVIREYRPDAAPGILIPFFARHTAKTIGNAWVDLTRITLYVLLPISFVFAIFLVGQGVIQNFGG